MAGNIYTKIWYDLVEAKHGDEYLCLYLNRQASIKLWFKIVIIALTVIGMAFGYKSARVPVIISFVIICIMEILTGIENFVIRSVEDVSKIRALRLKYYERTNKIEELYDSVCNGEISDEDATSKFYQLRTVAIQIEDLDNQVNVKTFHRLQIRSSKSTRDYLNKYYPS